MKYPTSHFQRKQQGLAAMMLLWSSSSTAFVLRRQTLIAKRRTPGKRVSFFEMTADSRHLRFYSSPSPLSQDTSSTLDTLPTFNVPLNNAADSSSDTMPQPWDEDRKRSFYNASPRYFSSSDKTSPDGPNCYPINLTSGEQELFETLMKVINEKKIPTTLRVAGGWVRDKLLATEAFQKSSVITNNSSNQLERLTSKFKEPSAGRMGGKIIGGVSSLVNDADAPVDIDIALDNMLGREFADCLNEWLSTHGRETHSVGLVLKNPEKSKHLETATMKVGKFWIDFVNLRAEEYTEDSRIPDLMRIGTAQEDAFRRDLTINALFYNINTGQVEDMTGMGFEHLKKGVVATPLPPLTTLLDDPLRVLRSVRFAARLRFNMDESLRDAALHKNVRVALGQKVSRERVGSEVDLMFRSQDPVGAMRLLINLNLHETVFPIPVTLDEDTLAIFEKGLHLLSTTHDHLCECKSNTPIWCESKRAAKAAMYGANENILINDDEARRKLWYAAFLKPFQQYAQSPSASNLSKRKQGKKANRSVIMKLMVDDLKRPLRDAEAVERIMKAADEITLLIDSGCDLSATTVLLSDVRVSHDADGRITCYMGNRVIEADSEEDPIWLHAMEYRLLASNFLRKVGSLWRAALILSLSEQLAQVEQKFSYTIEGDVVSYNYFFIAYQDIRISHNIMFVFPKIRINNIFSLMKQVWKLEMELFNSMIALPPRYSNLALLEFGHKNPY